MPGVLNPAVSQGKLLPEQRETLRKLLSSQTFASAPRLREVLSYLLTAVESGTSEQVTEQAIGQAVFGRPAGYNASEDNIVRVTIRHLRSRLEEYYQSEGQDDTWVLSIPKGKYLPVVAEADRLAAKVQNVIQSSPVLPEPDRLPAPQTADGVRSSGSGRLVAIICLAMLLGAVAGYLLRPTWGHRPTTSGGVLGQLCRAGEDISVVVVDSNLEAYRQIFHRQVTLDQYIHRTYAQESVSVADPRMKDAQEFSTGTNETNVSSAIVAAALQQALSGHHIAIKHPHDVSIREFQDQKTVILLGGPFINPWAQLFESRLNFRVSPLPEAPSGSWIRNLQPQPGEPAQYVPHREGDLNVNYVRVAILPNFVGSGHVVMLGATSPEALEQAGTYLISNEGVAELEAVYHEHTIASLPALEFVMEVRGLNAVPNGYRILSYRRVPAPANR